MKIEPPLTEARVHAALIEVCAQGESADWWEYAARAVYDRLMDPTEPNPAYRDASSESRPPCECHPTITDDAD